MVVFDLDYKQPKGTLGNLGSSFVIQKNMFVLQIKEEKLQQYKILVSDVYFSESKGKLI